MAQAIVGIKKCMKCGTIKQLTEFYNNSRYSNNGVRPECKECSRAYVRSYRNTPSGRAAVNRGMKKYKRGSKGRATAKRYLDKIRHTNTHKARLAVKLAVMIGFMPGARERPCDACGKPAHGYHHHRGYEPHHWLDVVPLCTKCHQLSEHVHLE